MAHFRHCISVMVGGILMMAGAAINAGPFSGKRGEGVRYLGEYCFVLNDGTLFPAMGSRVGVLGFGPDHAMVSGVVRFIGEAYGTAVMTDDLVAINMTGMAGDFSSEGSVGIYVSQLRMSVDRATREGSYVITGYVLPDDEGSAENHIVLGGRVDPLACENLGVTTKEWDMSKGGGER